MIYTTNGVLVNMRPIFCISDLHLCDRGPRDNFFARREDRFQRFLDYVDKEEGELFILGDFFEWWQCNFSAVILAYSDLIQRLNAMNAHWIVGNHDNSLEAFPGGTFKISDIELPCMSKEITLIRNKKKILLCHGHEADTTCCDLNPGVGTITSIISGMLEDKNKGPVKNSTVIEDRFIGTLESALNVWRWLGQEHGRRKELLDGVEAFRKENEADVVIYGHTHEPGRIGKHHYNCGCWCRDTDTFVRIDESIRLFEWDGTKAISFDQEL